MAEGIKHDLVTGPSVTAYVNSKCRCTGCKAKWAAYMAERRANEKEEKAMTTNQPVPGLDVDALAAKLRQNMGLPPEDPASKAATSVAADVQLKTAQRKATRESAQRLAASYGRPDLSETLYALMASDLPDDVRYTQISSLFGGQVPQQPTAPEGQPQPGQPQPGEDPDDPSTWSDETFAAWRAQHIQSAHPSLPGNFIRGKSKTTSRGMFDGIEGYNGWS